MNNELSEQVKAVASMVKIARNQKPKKHQKTNRTRQQEDDLLQKMTFQIQSELIAYECLKAAVKLSKDNKAISKTAADMINSLPVSRVVVKK